MFKKLITNLPFNPSLVQQVSFYAKRLHKETRLRLIGLILLAITLCLQVFSVASPPQPSLAASANDLIPGGFSHLIYAVDHCNKNNYGYRDILAHYGISCDDVAHAQTVSIRSTDYNKQLYSMGRLPYGKAGEYPVNINGTVFYMRYLWGWDTAGASTYNALRGTKSNGETFFLLYTCGNVVIIGKPSAPPPPPPPPPPTDLCPNIPGIQSSTSQCDVCPSIPGIQSSLSACKPCSKSTSDTDTESCLTLSKSARNITQNLKDAQSAEAHAGDVIEYTLTVTNQAKITATKFVVQENLADVLEYANVTDTHGGTLNESVIKWPATDINAQSVIRKKITIKVKDPIPDTPVSASNPASYDLIMTNVYGNAVNIRLPKSPLKTTEQVTTTLPNTGPGATVIAGFFTLSVAGYLFARSRLLAKELDIAKTVSEES